MSRLLAYIANDPQRIRCALYPGRDELRGRRDIENGIDSVGFGFHEGGEVLLQRRPRPSAMPLDFYDLIGDLKGDVLIGHMRRATVGGVKTENTHPFRFRSWLFAHHGTVARFEAAREGLLASMPDFLRRNIRGETDSEHLFHAFLGVLQRAGRLDDPLLPPEVARQALGETMALVDRLVGGDESTLDLAATNGRILVASTRGAPMRFYEVNGIRECPVCRESPSDSARSGGRPFEHDHLRAFVLVADEAMGPLRPPWRDVPAGSLISVSHALQLEVTPIA